MMCKGMLGLDIALQQIVCGFKEKPACFQLILIPFKEPELATAYIPGSISYTRDVGRSVGEIIKT